MTDCFELLQEPRRPWLDADALKARFLKLSAAAHPDRFHGGTDSERAQANDRSAELNAAYNTLRETRDRFLAYRERCRSEACIAEAYEGRIREIEDIASER